MDLFVNVRVANRVMTTAELIQELDCLKAIMISVATGGPRIQEVQPEFARRFDAVSLELSSRGIENSLPYRDLWQWYGYWSGTEALDTYRARREYVAGLFAPLIKTVQTGPAVEFAATGWQRVDRTAMELRNRLASSQNEEQFQAVGLLCRELLISLGQAVFSADEHPTLDGITASSTDAKRMLEAYIAATLAGSANEYVRKHARAAIDLALHLQHKRTATFRDAAFCVEATISATNLIAIISGRRDPVV
jgi:hypothetical protein